MSKQPDKDLKAVLWELGIWEDITHAQHVALEQFVRKAQLQLVNELIEKKRKYMKVEFNPKIRTVDCEAIPLTALKKVKANLLGKGE